MSTSVSISASGTNTGYNTCYTCTTTGTGSSSTPVSNASAKLTPAEMASATNASYIQYYHMLRIRVVPKATYDSASATVRTTKTLLTKTEPGSTTFWYNAGLIDKFSGSPYFYGF